MYFIPTIKNGKASDFSKPGLETLEDIRGFKIVREGNFQLIFKSLINLSIKYKGRIHTFIRYEVLKSMLPMYLSSGGNRGTGSIKKNVEAK